MGKLVYFMTMLVIIDILFLATGQLGLESPNALMISMITDPASIEASQFWTVMVGSGGLAALVAAVGVVAIGVFSATNIIIFLPMAILLASLVGDFVVIYSKLAEINLLLGLLSLVPVMMVYVLVTIEWLRGKD